ncbi:MAG TPA: hypothetical protein VFP71_15225 [Candidatus Angelobacter sp.]|nr:hypothetical protein [Candidatus Angelobacter sp.]
MIERVVESWLTNVNERQYQIPFCQLLMAEGEEVIHISTHGQMEQGKDVITKSKSRGIKAYQLKCGRIALADWRRHRSEIIELVEYPIEHPSIRSRKSHESVLVTNGSIADTVINAVRSENRAWRRRRVGHLQVTTGSELVTRFVRAHGSYLPQTPKDFGKFLDLIVDGGRGPFNKKDFSAFIETVLPLKKSRVPFREVQRAMVSAVLLTTYIIQRDEQCDNHWAIFEAWITLGAYILAVHERYHVPSQWWKPSFELAQLGALRALENLCRECEANETMFTQGNPLIDGHVYHARITILGGLLSSLSLHHRIKKSDWNKHEFVHDFLEWYGSYFRLLGESLVPHLLLAIMTLEQNQNGLSANNLLRQIIIAICQQNGAKESKENQGLPNPYYEPEAILRHGYGIGIPLTESFWGHSYALEPLVLFAAAKNQRQLLNELWKQITRVHFAVFSPTETWEWFRWQAEEGALHTKMPEAPQSWRELRTIATSPTGNSPEVLKAIPEFVPFFLMVFPHRLSYELIKLIDDALSQSINT